MNAIFHKLQAAVNSTVGPSSVGDGPTLLEVGDSVGVGGGDDISATSAIDGATETHASGVDAGHADRVGGESGASGTTDDVDDRVSSDHESTSMVNGGVDVGAAVGTPSVVTTPGGPLEYATALKELVSLAARLRKFDLVEVCWHPHSFVFRSCSSTVWKLHTNTTYSISILCFSLCVFFCPCHLDLTSGFHTPTLTSWSSYHISLFCMGLVTNRTRANSFSAQMTLREDRSCPPTRTMSQAATTSRARLLSPQPCSFSTTTLPWHRLWPRCSAPALASGWPLVT